MRNVRHPATDMLFSDWESLFRIVVVGTLGYVGLVLILRVSGKRVLSKMNAFDFIVTIAFGSVLATMVLSRDVALLDGLVALGILAGLQFVVTWISVRSDRFKQLITAEPRLLAFDGRLLHGALRDERIAHIEVEAAVREAGLPGIEAAYAIVLETQGVLTVIPRTADTEHLGALRNVRGAPGTARPALGE